MTCRIKIAGYADGRSCPLVGCYLQEFNFEADDGTFTDDRDDALEFANAGAAMDFWRTQSLTVPIRPDGRPNKPLTMFSIEIEGDDDDC